MFLKKILYSWRGGASAAVNLAGGRVARHAGIIKNQHIFILNTMLIFNCKSIFFMAKLMSGYMHFLRVTLYSKKHMTKAI